MLNYYIKFSVFFKKVEKMAKFDLKMLLFVTF